MQLLIGQVVVEFVHFWKFGKLPGQAGIVSQLLGRQPRPCINSEGTYFPKLSSHSISSKSPGEKHWLSQMNVLVFACIVCWHPLNAKHSVKNSTLVIVSIAGIASPLKEVARYFHHVVSCAGLLSVAACPVLHRSNCNE